MNQIDQLKDTKILLIDDDELLRDSLRMVFDTKGCFIKTAETAEKGLRFLVEEKYDIIISDLRLPGINGLRFLKFASLIQAEPIKLLITAYKDDPIIKETERIGVDEVIEKPFSVDALAESMAEAIKNGKN